MSFSFLGILPPPLISVPCCSGLPCSDKVSEDIKENVSILVYSFRCFHCGGLALLFLHCGDTEYPAREGVARQSFHFLETGRRERERKKERG